MGKRGPMVGRIEVIPYLAPDPPLTLADLSSMTRPGSGGHDYHGAITFATGRAALLAGLVALGIGPGDDVLLPAYLCESVVTPVEAVGARAVFFPIGRSFEVDLEALERAVGPKTRAILLIHYLGFPGPVEAVRALCDRRGLALIEDCAHALYSRHGDRRLGTYGDLAIFSPWKSLPLPDGGLLVVNRPDLAPTVPRKRPMAHRTAARLGYRALGTVEQAIGWSPRLMLLQRPGLRRSLHEQVSAGQVELLAASALSGRLLRGARADRVVARRRRSFARLLEPSVPRASGGRLSARTAARGRRPGLLARPTPAAWRERANLLGTAPGRCRRQSVPGRGMAPRPYPRAAGAPGITL
jgi:DegT/DnrJ/EryC1/StrS aminotransferase family